jgi:hypothetical protein
MGVVWECNVRTGRDAPPLPLELSPCHRDTPSPLQVLANSLAMLVLLLGIVTDGGYPAQCLTST